jgi:hypothetical protein
MLERPYLLVETFQAQAEPFMERFETPGIESGALKPAAGHKTWIRTSPWLLLSELHCAADDSDGNPLAHEESFATICLRLLGVVEGLLAESLSLVDAQLNDRARRTEHFPADVSTTPRSGSTDGGKPRFPPRSHGRVVRTAGRSTVGG